MQLDGLLPVSTAATRAAMKVAVRFQTRSLVEHCSRAYLWAVYLGERSGFQLDRELLYVAAMLHDLGLSPTFDNVSHAFEVTGGDVGWVFAAAADWEQHQADHLRAIIIQHMAQRAPAPEDDPESYVLHLATGFDISGLHPELWPTEFQTAVLAEHPRLELAAEFARAFEDQASRKPTCAAAISLRAGIIHRIAANPLDG